MKVPRATAAALASTLLCTLVSGCAATPSRSSSRALSTPVHVRSNNLSTVDVYLLCGDQNAVWIGSIEPRDAAELAIPAARTLCIRGLNFFLVDRLHNHGYWVGPFRPASGTRVDLLIEKYAGLSTAQLTRGDW